MINTRVRLSHFEKMLITLEFFGKARYLMNISRANYNYVFIDLSIIEITFSRKLIHF